ncbi:hypothetical protein NESM_000320200 [Novymonas esmeraldas]|uniref:Uncharacterized protein n=1 Tax=Novymonas esmeraldas TaxID=1808958 RepID=A0AAW0EME6_9TRYP
MSFFVTPRLRAAAATSAAAASSRLPFILVSSPPLRQTSSLLRGETRRTLTPAAIARELRVPVPHGSQSSPDADAAAASPKEVKRRGFNALIRWCAYHQEAGQLDCAGAADSTGAKDVEKMDRAVVRWVQQSAGAFSCGQSLVVLTFLCDVLRRQRAAEDGGSVSSEWPPSELIGSLYDCIAVVLAGAAASEQLDGQPLLILLSAHYGLYSVANGSVLKAWPDMLPEVAAPLSLWYALVQQLRRSFVGDKIELPGLSEQTMTEALLTTTLLFDDARRSLYIAPHFFLSTATFTKLHSLILPDVKLSMQARKQALVAGASASSNPSSPGDAADADLADADSHGVAEVAAQMATALPQPYSSLRNLDEVAVVIRNMRSAPVAIRVEVTYYLLCVRRDPATYTAEELQQLPSVLFSVRSPYFVRRSSVADVVLSRAPSLTLETLVGISAYSHQKLRYTLQVIDLLRRRLHDEDGCEESPGAVLGQETAASILCGFEDALPLPLLRLVVLSAVATLPGVVAAVQSATDDGDAGGALQLRVTDGALVKTPLGDMVCVVLQALQRRLSQGGKKNAARMARLEKERVVHRMYAAVISAIDWRGVSAESFSPSREREYVLISMIGIIETSLSAYILGRVKYRCLSAADAVETDVLRYAITTLLTLEKESTQVATSIFALCARVASLLPPDAEGVAEVIGRLLRLEYTSARDWLGLFAWHLAPLATKWKVAAPDKTALLLRQRNLCSFLFSDTANRHGGAARAHKIVVVRFVRYLLAIGALKSGSSAVIEAHRAAVRGWILHLFFVSKALSGGGGQDGRLSGDGGGGAPGAATVADEDAGGDVDGYGDAAAELPSKDDGDVSQGHVVLDDSDFVDHSSDLHKPLTDADVEEVLSLALMAGVSLGTRWSQAVAQRVAERTALLGDPLASASWTAPLTATLAGEDATTGGLAPLWSAPAVGNTPDADVSMAHTPPPPPPLAAHFVVVVRSDSAALLPPLSPALLATMLATCEFPIFHMVFSSFLTAVRRSGPAPLLLQDFRIGAVALAALHNRLTAERIEDIRHRGTVVSKTIMSFLLYMSSVPWHLNTTQLRVLLCLHRTTDIPSAVEDRPGHGEGAGDGDGDCGDEYAAEGEKDDFGAILAARVEVEDYMTRLLPCLEEPAVKQLALVHLRLLSFFLPRVPSVVVGRLQSQMSNFSQRELLQLAAQYPAGAADVLALLSKVDMYASIDISDFVALAKRLPMVINTAVVEAHLPHMSMAWITRVLAAQARRHQEVPLQLLRSLLGRVPALMEGTSEADKSLLMVVLQNYLLFPAAQRAPEERLAASMADAKEKTIATVEDALWEAVSPLHPVPAADQRERRELIRTCCDSLLSLEHISTLDALRFFLVSYPPSLHEMREVGVVAKVEQQLLPDILGASPIQWRELGALVRLLAEHRVLLPSTVRILADRIFTEAHLSRLRETVAATAANDVALVMEALIRIATWCGEVAAPGAPPPLALLPVTERVLQVFDDTQCRLAVLTRLLRIQTPATTGAAASTSASLSLSLAEEAVGRHICRVLLDRSEGLNPSEFARLVQGVSRLKAWDLLWSDKSSTAAAGATRFDSIFASCYERADAHSRCVFLKAIAMDTSVLRRFESVVFPLIQNDVPLLSPDDLELVLAAAAQASSEAVVESVLDAIDTRMLSVLDQCRRSALVRLLQVHTLFAVDDQVVVTAVLQSLERQSPSELKLDVAQVLHVLQSVASLTASQMPARLVFLCFQRLEKAASSLTPLQQYHVGRLILDLEMGHTSSVSALVLHILESRDGMRGHKQFQAMTEELCDVFEVELPSPLWAARLRKRKSKQRVQDFWSAQRKVKEEARLHHCQS